MKNDIKKSFLLMFTFFLSLQSLCSAATKWPAEIAGIESGKEAVKAKRALLLGAYGQPKDELRRISCDEDGNYYDDHLDALYALLTEENSDAEGFEVPDQQDMADDLDKSAVRVSAPKKFLDCVSCCSGSVKACARFCVDHPVAVSCSSTVACLVCGYVTGGISTAPAIAGTSLAQTSGNVSMCSYLAAAVCGTRTAYTSGCCCFRKKPGLSDADQLVNLLKKLSADKPKGKDE